MSQNKATEQSKTDRLRRVRLLFGVIMAAAVAAVVLTVTWLVRRDTPRKAVRSAMKELVSQGGSMADFIPADSDDEACASALGIFFGQFSFRILSVSQEKESASAKVSITTPDSRELAADIRLYLLQHADEERTEESSEVYTLLEQFLSENTYPAVETVGTVNLTKEPDGWTLVQDSALTSLLLGHLPEYLSDPYLLTPEQVLTVYLEKLDTMSVQEWSEAFGVDDLFCVYSSYSDEIDEEFLTRAKEAWSWSDVRADVTGSSAEVSVLIRGIDTASVLASYKEKLAAYGSTVTAITDDASRTGTRSAELLLEAIRENDSSAEFPVTVTMENNGNGWVVKDSSALTDALFGGMADAVGGFTG